MGKGYYIIIEGLDGAGKSTLIKSLQEGLSLAFPSHNIFVTKEPGGTPLGSLIRSFLQKQTAPLTPLAEFFLFSADRAQHYEEVIAPKVMRGDSVISDRSYYSSIAYQGFGLGLDKEQITQVSRWILSDVVDQEILLFLDLPEVVREERIVANRQESSTIEQRSADFFKRVREGFLQICKKHPAAVVIDASRQPEAVAQEALSFVAAQLASKFNKSL